MRMMNFSSADEPELSVPDNQQIQLYKFAVPVVILVCLLATALNCLLLFNVCRIKCPLKATTILTLSLSAADAWSSLLVAMGFFINAYLPVVLQVDASEVYCVVLTVEGFRLGSIFTSTAHLLYMALAHFFTAKSSRPTSSASTNDKLYLIMAIAVAFIVPPAFFLILFGSVPNQGFQSYGCWDFEFLMELPFRATVFATIMIVFLLIIFLYVSVYRAAIRKASATIPGRPSFLAVRSIVERKRKVAVTFLLVTFSFFLGWLPVFLTSVLLCPNCSLTVVLRDWRPLLVPLINFSVNILLAVKFLLNPLLYALRVPEVRVTISKLMSSARSTRTGYESLSPQSLPMLPRAITSGNFIESSRKVAQSCPKLNSV